MVPFLPLLGLIGGLGVGSAVDDPDTGWEVGDRFPDLVLPSLADGSPLSIHDFRGQKLILHVFASW